MPMTPGSILVQNNSPQRRKGAKTQRFIMEDAMLREDALSREIIGAAIEVHQQLGPGLLESIYEHCLLKELNERGMHCLNQAPLPVRYKGELLDCEFRLDLLVENIVVVELKTVKKLESIHDAQLLSYLRLSGCKLGLLINFNVPVLKHGIKRIVNNL
jgi:GxxExxY protein